MIFLEKFLTLSEKRAGVLCDGGSCTRVWPSFFQQRTRGTGPLVPCCGKKLPVKLKNAFWERKRLQLQLLCFFRKTEGFCPSVFLKKQSLTQLTKTCRGTVRRWLLSGGGRTFSKKTQGLNLRSFYWEVALKLKPSSERENDFNFSFVQFSERAEGVNLLPF